MPDIQEWNLRLQEKFKKIPSFKESIINIHNPLEEDYLPNSSTYMMRLAYDEIFAYQLSLAILRDNLKKLDSNKFSLCPSLIIDYFKSLLSFKPTTDQENAAIEIIDDIRSEKEPLDYYTEMLALEKP